MFHIVLIWFDSDSWVATYIFITPSFQPCEPHFRHLSFGECERSLGVGAYFSFCEERGYSFKFESFSIPSEFFKWEIFYKFKNFIFSFTSTFFLNSEHIFSKLPNFSLIQLPWDKLIGYGLHSHIFIQNSWNTSHFLLKNISLWSYMKISTCGFMIQICVFWLKFHLCTWNLLFGLHAKFVSFSINSTKICIESGDNVRNVSKFTFEIPYCFKHVYFLSYLLVTLHLPWPLTDGEASKADKLSFTHPIWIH